MKTLYKFSQVFLLSYHYTWDHFLPVHHNMLYLFDAETPYQSLHVFYNEQNPEHLLKVALDFHLNI